MSRKILQVGYLNPLKSYGGVEKYILNLSKSINNIYGATVDVLCANKKCEILNSDFGKIVSIKVPFFERRNLFFISKFIYARYVMHFLNEHFNEYDVIHFHGDAGLIGKVFSERTLLTLHGVSRSVKSIKKRITTYLPTLIEINNVKNAKMIFTVSPEAKEFFGKYRSDIHMIKQSVDTSFYHVPSGENKVKSREKLGIENHIIAGIIIGREPIRKGLKIAIDAVQALGDSNVMLYAIGFPKVQKVHDGVIFTGDIDEDTKLLYLTACDFFIFPSAKEGFPISALEAAAFGLPMIVSKHSSISELADFVPFFREIDSYDPYEYTNVIRILVNLLSNHELNKVTNNINQIEQYSVLVSTRIYVDAYEHLQ